VPAALAAAETSERATGRAADMHELLAAIAVGYEVQLYLGAIAAQGIMSRGFRTTSVLGSVGAASAVARLYRLSYAQATTAIALAANMSSGLLEAWSHGTEEPFLHAGLAARNGVLAGLLAQAGTVAAAQTLEGPNGFLRAFADVQPEAFDELGQDWRIHGVLCKPYPISGAKLTAVDSALHAYEQGVDTEKIQKVTVWVPPLTKEFPGGDRVGPFETMTQAQDSTPFCVSAALLGRPMASVRTYVEGFANPQVSQLSQLVQIVGEQGRELARVEVVLTDGRLVVGEIDRRDQHRPTLDRMAAKLRLLTDAWDHGNADEVIALVCSPQAMLVGELSPLLQRPRQR